jgi:hypothetical protein
LADCSRVLLASRFDAFANVSLPAKLAQHAIPTKFHPTVEHCIPTHGWLNKKVGSFSSPGSKVSVFMTTNTRRLTTVAMALTMLAIIAGSCAHGSAPPNTRRVTASYAPAN